MKETKWDPACSFCGARPPSELVRAGGRDFWICSACVERPAVEDIDNSDVRCTFCEERIRHTTGSGVSAERQVAVAGRGAVLCTECIQVCRQIISEDRAFRARRPRWAGLCVHIEDVDGHVDWCPLPSKSAPRISCASTGSKSLSVVVRLSPYFPCRTTDHIRRVRSKCL